jgi:hypothetical protein
VEAAHLPSIDLALLEAVVREVDDVLFSGEIGVVLRHGEVIHEVGHAPKTWFENSIGVR